MKVDDRGGDLEQGGQSAPPIPSSAKQWTEIARLLSQSQRVVSQLLTGLAPLSESELILLWVCSDAPPEGLAQVGLSESLGISPGQISSIVERLRNRGFLESSRSASDRRRRHWQLTVAGRHQLSEAGHALAERVAQLPLEPLGSSERELLCQFLSQLAHAKHDSVRSSEAVTRKERAA